MEIKPFGAGIGLGIHRQAEICPWIRSSSLLNVHPDLPNDYKFIHLLTLIRWRFLFKKNFHQDWTVATLLALCMPQNPFINPLQPGSLPESIRCVSPCKEMLAGTCQHGGFVFAHLGVSHGCKNCCSPSNHQMLWKKCYSKYTLHGAAATTSF